MKSSRDNLPMARILAPEEIRCRDFVTVLNEVIEFPSFLWCGDGISTPPEKPIRWTCCASDSGFPYRVVSVCLPFVCLRGPGKKTRTVDLRQAQIARLSRGYAKQVWKQLQEKSPLGL